MRSKEGAERSEKSNKLPITSLFFLTYRFLSPILVPVNARNAPGAPRGRLLHPIPTADFLSAHGSAAVSIAATGIANYLQNGGRSVRIGKTRQLPVFPAQSPETGRGTPCKSTRNNILLCGILCYNRQGAPDRRCPEKPASTRRCPQRRSAPAGRSGIFFKYGTICPVEGNGSRSCFLAPFAGIGY